MLIVEGLSRVLIKAKKRGTIKSIKICLVNLTHLLFMGDIF
jgi:hypothetical protein